MWRDTSVEGYGHGADGNGGGWEGLRQVVLIRTTTEYLNGSKATAREDHYYLTSAPPADAGWGSPQWALETARSHWSIENQLHHVKDRSLREDEQQTRRGAVTFSFLRSLAVGLLMKVKGQTVPQKRIRLACHPSKAVALLKKPFKEIKCYL